jgi:glycosyltransferase involved in cell wall biosynthesis
LQDELKSKLFDPRRVIELGFLSYKKYVVFLPSADVFLFTFTNTQLNLGRWPNKIGDYMAAGRPTVSNYTGDLIYLFNKHKIGLLASENPEDIASKTIRFLDDREYATDIGKKARHAAEQFYDWKILARRLEKCFFKVVEEQIKNGR